MEQGTKLIRRHFIVSGGALAAAGFALRPSLAATAKVILVVGDSLSAEYGLPRGRGWVALLDARLRAEGVPARVINASISGDTTAGGSARLAPLLEQHKPDVVIIELGGNDALRGLDLAQTREHLLAMTSLAQASGARVLLLGMQVPPNYGADYARRFAEVFREVARERRAALVPFFLKNVADVPEAAALFQADQIHPNEKAQAIMLDNVWPQLRKLLR